MNDVTAVYIRVERNMVFNFDATLTSILCGIGSLEVCGTIFIFQKSAISSEFTLVSPSPALQSPLVSYRRPRQLTPGGGWRAAVNGSPAYRNFRNVLVMLC